MTGLRRYIRPYYGYILLTMLIKFFGALVELLIPYLLETILDDVVPTGSRSGILLTGGAMVLCALLCVQYCGQPHVRQKRGEHHAGFAS